MVSLRDGPLEDLRKVMGGRGVGKKTKKKIMQGKMPRKKIPAKKKVKKKNSCRRKVQL